MKIYDYQKFNNVYLGGSILNEEENLLSIISSRLSKPGDVELHPKEIERLERLKKRKKKVSPFRGNVLKKMVGGVFNNSVIIFSGSVGFGIKSFEHFDEIFKKLNEVLDENNVHILFVRGNNDDPSYFTNEKINYSNIKTVEDYSIVKFKGFDCLCIGGGVSIDRKWKQMQSERLKKTLYWENESTEYDPETLKKLILENNIAFVVTHEPPTFIGEDTSSYEKSKWAANDKDVVVDAIKERVIMDSVYCDFVKFNKKPYIWAFTGANSSHVNNIRFISIKNINSITNLNETMENVFGFRFEDDKTAKKDKKYLSSIKNDFEAFYDDEMEVELDGDAEIPEVNAHGEMPQAALFENRNDDGNRLREAFARAGNRIGIGENGINPEYFQVRHEERPPHEQILWNPGRIVANHADDELIP